VIALDHLKDRSYRDVLLETLTHSSVEADARVIPICDERSHVIHRSLRRLWEETTRTNVSRFVSLEIISNPYRELRLPEPLASGHASWMP